MAAAADSISNKRLTLVEDDPDVTALVQGLAADHQLDVFADGVSAVDALTGDLPLPQVILLDLDLPGMHGLEVLKRLRHHPRTRRVPIVIFTATDQLPDEGYRLGANAWVAKSRDAGTLEATLQATLAFWTGLNQPAGLLRG